MVFFLHAPTLLTDVTIQVRLRPVQPDVPAHVPQRSAVRAAEEAAGASAVDDGAQGGAGAPGDQRPIRVQPKASASAGRRR